MLKCIYKEFKIDFIYKSNKNTPKEFWGYRLERGCLSNYYTSFNKAHACISLLPICF